MEAREDCASRSSIVVRNPFKKPLTPRQWLVSSICWTITTVLAWLVFNYLQACALQEMGVPTGLDFTLAIGSFCLAYIVLWQRVVRGPQLVVHAPITLKVAMWLWRIGVATFQLLCLGVALLLLDFRLIDSAPQNLDMLP